jgi:hypothetical protein
MGGYGRGHANAAEELLVLTFVIQAGGRGALAVQFPERPRYEPGAFR